MSWPSGDASGPVKPSSRACGSAVDAELAVFALQLPLASEHLGMISSVSSSAGETRDAWALSRHVRELEGGETRDGWTLSRRYVKRSPAANPQRARFRLARSRQRSSGARARRCAVEGWSAGRRSRSDRRAGMEQLPTLRGGGSGLFFGSPGAQGISKALFMTMTEAPVKAGTVARRNSMTMQLPAVVLSNFGVRMETEATLPVGS
jgi:hypothetical protein